jgi:hypothetical protein
VIISEFESNFERFFSNGAGIDEDNIAAPEDDVVIFSLEPILSSGARGPKVVEVVLSNKAILWRVEFLGR